MASGTQAADEHLKPVPADGCDDLGSLLNRIRNGSQDAAWELIEKYGRHVYRLVRRRMSREMRTFCDSNDFVQAVWVSFFTDSERLRSIDDPEHILALLAAMARNKVIDVARQRAAGRRGVNIPHQSFEDLTRPEKELLYSHDPTPSQIAHAKERWDLLLRGTSGREREVLLLRFQGVSNSEIASRLEISERTVMRVVESLRYLYEK